MTATDMDTARALVRRAQRPVSFSGAGLSAESGIATFRGGDDSLWSKYDPIQLASEDGFLVNPSLVTDWYASRRRALAEAKPNSGHVALANAPRWLHVTQNVDNLLERAGAMPDTVMHLHGSLLADRCLRACGYQVDVDMAAPPGLRDCPQCGAPMRPTVVWFGEALPEPVWAAATAAIEQCDLLLVVGTSAAVYPAAGLIEVARRRGASVICVNPEDAVTSGADVFLRATAAETLPLLLNGE